MAARNQSDGSQVGKGEIPDRGHHYAAGWLQPVVSRTLDSQRITSLSPMRLLMGIVFGESISVYMLTLGTLPMAILLSQIAGLQIWVVGYFILITFTTTFMVAAAQTIHDFEPGEPGKPQKPRTPVSALGVVWVLCIFIAPVVGVGAGQGFFSGHMMRPTSRSLLVRLR